MRIVRATTAQEALDLARPQLTAAGAEGELVYGLLNRLSEEPDAWGLPVSMLVGFAGDEPIAIVIRTGTNPVHPASIVGFVDETDIDYEAFVREMKDLHHVPSSVNGAVRCTVPFASAWAKESGCSTRTFRELVAFELHELRLPSTINGFARVAGPADAELLFPWCEGFARDIGEPMVDGEAAKAVARHTTSGDMMLWLTGETPVSMAAINRRTPSSSCVAWVYTPPEHRKHGYASAIVAALTQRELEAGASWCSLFTDAANPTSNHIYSELGYEPRCEFRHIELVHPRP